MIFESLNETAYFLNFTSTYSVIKRFPSQGIRLCTIEEYLRVVQSSFKMRYYPSAKPRSIFQPIMNATNLWAVVNFRFGCLLMRV